MAIPTSKPLSLSAVQTEFGGSNPISMSEYRGNGNAPATGAIDLWADFNGTSAAVTQNGILYWDEGQQYYSGTGGAGSPHGYNSYVSGWEGSTTADTNALATPDNLEWFTDFPFQRMFKLRFSSGTGFAGKTITNITKCKLYLKIDSGTEDTPPLANEGTADSRYAIGIGADATFSSYLDTFQGLDKDQGEAASGIAGGNVTVEYDLLTNLGATNAATWITNRMPLYVGMKGESIDWSYGGAPPQGSSGTTSTAAGRPFAFWVDATFTYS